MGSFLTRETLGFAEFTEALSRLHDEQLGIPPESKDYGIPSGSYYDETYGGYPQHDDDGAYDSYGWSWYNEDEEQQDSQQQPSQQEGQTPRASSRPPSATGQSPAARSQGQASRRSVGISVQSLGAVPETGELDEMGIADSFIMGVLRGWRLLQAAGLTHEEKRDILSTTQNRMDYDSISRALQVLWDDQLLGRREQHQQHGILGAQEAFEDSDNNTTTWHDNQWGDTWWDDEMYQGMWHEQGQVDDWDSTWHDTQAHVHDAPHDPDVDAKLQEAQQAEHIAEQLAAEATRT